MDIFRHDDLNCLQEEALTTESPERLQSLSKLAEQYYEREAILRAIMNNPNTPPTMLFKLGADFPQELLEHPMFNLLLLENPFDLVKAMPHETQVSLLGLNNLPFSILKILVQNFSIDIRFKITYNPNTPINLLEILAQDTDKKVRGCVARHPNTPINLLEILAHYPNQFVRSGVAQNPNTPINLLEILAHYPNQFVRSGVARNPNTPINLLEILAHYPNQFVRSGVA